MVDHIGRLAYGNDAGLWNNIVSPLELRRLRAGFGNRPSDNTPDAILAAEFHRQGFVRLPDRYPADLIGRIQRRYRSLIDDPAASFATRPADVSRRVVLPLQNVPELAHLVTEEVGRILEAYYGTHFDVRAVQAWRNRPLGPGFAGQDVYSNLWHCDEARTYRTKLFVNLSDVTRETGALRLHTRESTADVMRAGFLSRDWMSDKARRALEDESTIVYFEGPAGSAILCNTHVCLHRAGVPAPGTLRDIVEFKFEPSPAIDWTSRVPPDPEDVAYLESRRHHA